MNFARMYLFKNYCNKFKFTIAKYLHVISIPALQDNYMYVVINRTQKEAVAIDPVEPHKIMEIIKAEGVELTGVLTTHHHADHAGGNKEISGMIPDIPIFGGDSRIEGLTKKVNHGDVLTVASFKVNSLFTPCHTSGHMCYHIERKLSNVCFTGDTLFVGGCGRFFEGNAEHMIKALDVLSALPGDTKIYCGHEYTISNLQFASQVEPFNSHLSAKLTWASSMRSKNLPTVPSTIGDEKSYNPFMRIHVNAVKEFCQCSDPVAVMTTLRKLKDSFKST